MKNMGYHKETAKTSTSIGSLTEDELSLHWREPEGVKIVGNLPMLEFTLTGHNYWNGTSTRAHGDNYSNLVLQFQLCRDSGYYVLDFYIPAIFLVILSWVSFWLEAGAVPARVTIGSSSMLTFITLSRNLSVYLPKVSYVKAVDVYILMCSFFIFASLIEFAFVNSIWRRSRELELKKLSTGHVIKKALTPCGHRRFHSSLSQSERDYSDLNELTVGSVDQILAPNRQRKSGVFTKFRVTELWNQGQTKAIENSKSCPELIVTPADLTIKKESLSIPVPDFLPVEEKTDCSAFSITLSSNKECKERQTKSMSQKEIAKYIDRRSRIFFPVLFSIANIFYFSLVWI